MDDVLNGVTIHIYLFVFDTEIIKDDMISNINDV